MMTGWLAAAYAQAPRDVPGAPPDFSPIWSFTPFLIILVLFYFMIVRPQQQKLKKHQAMLDAMKKGDRVVTKGGLHGLVVNIAKDVITLQIADNVRIRVDREAIAEFRTEEET